jgi:O-acetylserine/cysteine efflux transporter
MNGRSLTLAHALLALAVVFVWGTNFVVIRVALTHVPPLLFATLRFFFSLVPAVFFLKRPAVPWRELAAYGVLIGAGQFGVLYIAMNGHISPGLASLVIQTQVFFTIALSILADRERLSALQWLALALAAAGIGVIVMHSGADATPLGIALTLFAAVSWACGNIVAKRGVGVNMLAYVVWASLFSVPPLLVMSLITEGWPAIVAGVTHADAATWAAVAWQSAGNTLFGFAAWGWLLTRYPAATITPMALLVPVFGMAASALQLGESLPAWKLVAAGLVLCGLALNLLGPQLLRRLRPD